MPLEIRYASQPAAKFRLTLPDTGLAVENCTALIGPSGAGKSTLVKALAGPIDELCITDTGQGPVGGAAPETIHNQVRARMAIDGEILAVHQDPADSFVLPHASLGGYQRRIRQMKGKDHAEAFAFHLRSLDLELAMYRDQRPELLSGGQQRRFALGLALSFRPSLLVIDEALGALDVKTCTTVMNHLAALIRNESLRVLLVSHDLFTLSLHTTSALVVRDGQVQLLRRLVQTDPEWETCLRDKFL